MSKLVKRAWAVFKAYFISEMTRSRGFIYGLMSFAIWITLMITPLMLFAEPGRDPRSISGYIFTGIIMFMFYTSATWDWAAELRWMINDGRLEYYIASGSGFLPHFLGILPISLIWLAIALLVNYAVLSIILGPPLLLFQEPYLLIAGFSLLLINLVGYALILGGSMIASGTSGFIVEILGFILPVATGGLTPLSVLPKPLQLFALITPFSYSAELIRYSLIATQPVLPLDTLFIRGSIYSLVFLSIGILFFKYQLKKIMKEGFRATSMW
ncbi:MAG: ABC transporter permease [Desulfurococcaceae archaeon]